MALWIMIADNIIGLKNNQKLVAIAVVKFVPIQIS